MPSAPTGMPIAGRTRGAVSPIALRSSTSSAAAFLRSCSCRQRAARRTRRRPRRDGSGGDPVRRGLLDATISASTLCPTGRSRRTRTRSPGIPPGTTRRSRPKRATAAPDRSTPVSVTTARRPCLQFRSICRAWPSRWRRRCGASPRGVAADSVCRPSLAHSASVSARRRGPSAGARRRSRRGLLERLGVVVERRATRPGRRPRRAALSPRPGNGCAGRRSSRSRRSARRSRGRSTSPARGATAAPPRHPGERLADALGTPRVLLHESVRSSRLMAMDLPSPSTS